jgi:hypothetical protein
MSDTKKFAEIRALYRNKKTEKISIEVGERRRLSEENDDWLDDEQWYCENVAKWTGGVDVSGPILMNPKELDKFLTAHFDNTRVEKEA